MIVIDIGFLLVLVLFDHFININKDYKDLLGSMLS